MTISFVVQIYPPRKMRTYYIKPRNVFKSFAIIRDNKKNKIAKIVLLLFCFIFLSGSLVSSYDFDEKIERCDNYNLTQIQCSDLWNFIENETNFTCVPEIVNNTIVQTINCSEKLDYLNAQYLHDEKMATISNGQCDFSDYILISMCDEKVYNEIQDYKNENSNGFSDLEPFDSDEDETPVYYYIIGAVLILGVYLYRKNKKKLSKAVSLVFNENNNSSRNLETPRYDSTKNSDELRGEYK